MNIIGSEISKARKAKGLTQEELAELSKVNLRTIQRIENGENEPRGKTLVLICEVLDLDVESLLQAKKKYADNNREGYCHGYKLATKGSRFLASLSETIIYTVVVFIPYEILKALSSREFLNRDSYWLEIDFIALFCLVVGGIFYPLFSGNLGHRLFGLKVINQNTGEDYNRAADGAIRELLKGVFSYLVSPIIWILWDEENQNLYDKLTKTIVVEKNSRGHA